MTRFSKSALLLGAALVVLSACSGTKGPGEIGSKEDIVVRNNGMPGSAKAPPPDADFSSTVEQAQAIPAPAVESAEPLPDQSPAVEAAAQKVAEASAPVASATAPVSTPATEEKRIDQVAPTTPVQDASNIAPPAQTTAATPAPEQIPVQPYAAPAAVPAPTEAPAPVAAPAPSSVYPAEDYASAGVAAPAVAPAPAPAPAPVAPTPSENAYVPVPAGTPYPLDPNAPYSPKAMAAASAVPTAAPAVTASGVNLSDPALIRSAQTALKTKAGYTGEVTGRVDAAFLNALTVYQGQNKLPLGGLNEATLRHLGVIQ